MAENLISRKYDVSPKTVYKKGPYMHSVVENFIGNDYSIPQLEVEKYIGKLRSHLSTALAKEQEFYDLIGVKDADDFSNTYLYALDKSAVDQETINRDIKTVQKILISIGSTLTLIQNKSIKSVLPDLERAARELIDNNEIPWVEEGAEQTALHSLRRFLESQAKENKGGKFSLKNNKGKTVKIDLPSAALRSDVGARVRSVLFKINPELKQLLTSSPSEKIANFKQYFIREAEKYGLDSEVIPLYWNRINILLESLQTKTDDDIGNLSAFSNFLGAEGALGEIAIALTLEGAFLNKAKIAVLANDTVTSAQMQYNAKEGKTVIKYTKSGERAKFTYKSPTDLTITVGSEVYSIQVKTSYTELTATKALKLQGNIELQTLLGNMVSQGYISDDTAQLLIYTMVNLSTPEMQNADGASSKTDLALRVLQMCAEYFAESYYAREVVNPLIEKGSENNKGNMFFIYSGRLVPMSAFIKAAIFALEGENLTLAKNYYDTVSYGRQYSIEEIKKHNYIGRFDLGQEVYQETKIREIAFIIAQMDRKMNAYLK